MFSKYVTTNISGFITSKTTLSPNDVLYLAVNDFTAELVDRGSGVYFARDTIGGRPDD